MTLAGLAAVLVLSTAATPTVDAIQLERFRIVSTPHAHGVAGMLSATVEQERSALAARLGRDYGGLTEIYVGDGIEELRAIAPHGISPPAWASGLALPSHNVLLFDARALRGESARQVLRHELAHLALARMGGGWPRWFQEGFAMLVAGEWSLDRYRAMYRATGEAAIPLSALETGWPERLGEVEVAYAESLSFVSYLYEKGGEDRFRTLISEVALGRRFDEAFRAAYGQGVSEAEDAWRSGLSSRYSWVPVVLAPGPLWALITLVFIGAWMKVRHRKRERLLQMELEEQAQEAAARIAAAERAAAAHPVSGAQAAEGSDPFAAPEDFAAVGDPSDSEDSDDADDSGDAGRPGPSRRTLLH